MVHLQLRPWQALEPWFDVCLQQSYGSPDAQVLLFIMQRKRLHPKMAAQAAQVDTARQKMVEPELDDWRLRYSVGSAINIRQAWLSEEHFLAVRQAYMIIIDHIYYIFIYDIAT